MFSVELRVLIEACRLYVGATGVSAWKTTIEDASLDWPRLQKLAEWHEIRPILYEALLQFSPINTPLGVLDSLKQTSRNLAVGNLLCMRQAQELTAIFQQHQIASVLHKGVHYATFYRAVGHREFGDIDILVNKKDVTKAIEVLLSVGYELWQPYESLRHITKTDYHVILVSSKQKAVVELHWQPTIQPWLDVGGIIDKHQSIYCLGVELPVPTLSYTANLLTAHHGFKENWQKLKYLLDLCLLVKATPIDIDQSVLHPKLKNAFDEGRLLVGQLLLRSTVQPTSVRTNWLHTAETLPNTTSNEANVEKNKENSLAKLRRGYYKFVALSWVTKKNLLVATFWIIIIKIMIKIVPFSTLKLWVTRLLKTSKHVSINDSQLSELAWAVGVVGARWPLKATCLPQALVYRYLTRHDPTLELKIGINTQQGFQAHAWVEKNSKIWIGNTPETFVPLWTLK